MPKTALPRRAATFAVGVIAALALTPAPSPADPSGGTTEQRIAAAEEQLEVVIEQFNGLREELRASQRRADALNAEITGLEGTLQARHAQVALLAATAYRTSNLRSLAAIEAFLGAAAAQENLVQPLLVLDRLAREQRVAIAELRAARTKLTDARRAVAAVTAAQQAQQRQLTVRKRQIEGELARLDRLRDAEDAHADRRTHRLPALPPGAAATVVRFVHAQLGKPYQWGGSGPHGYDCSGLTSAAWAAAGVTLPHNAARQWAAVTRISRVQRRPGDLVFYYPDTHHVAVYIGEGKIIHAPRPGKRIRVDRVDYQPVHGYGRPG